MSRQKTKTHLKENEQQKVRPVQIGRTYPCFIQGLGHSGEGVGRVDGFTVFVPYALPGETVLAEIKEVRANFARGRLVRLDQADLRRIDPACPVYEACGGCQLQHLSYAGQLEAKYRAVADAAARIGKLENVEIKPVIGMEHPWRYRNKAQFPVGQCGQAVVTGCFAAGTHRIVPTESCFIQHEWNDKLLTAVRRVTASSGVQPFDEATGEGVLRHIWGRVGLATGERMAVLVTAQLEDFSGKSRHGGRLAGMQCRS